MLSDPAHPPAHSGPPKRRPRRWRRRRVLSGCLSLAVLLLFATGYSDRSILFPSTEPLDTTGLTRHVIPLPQGGTIEAWAARTRGASRAGKVPHAYVLSFI